jgi:trehalose 6-phosphate phosphatase
MRAEHADEGVRNGAGVREGERAASAAAADRAGTEGVPMDRALREAILAAARSPVLLVATDFDGTVSELIAEPSAATILAPARDALAALAGLAHTRVAIITGRERADVARRVDLPVASNMYDDGSGLLVVGSHGLEREDGTVATAWTDEQATALTRLADAWSAVASRTRGAVVERKRLGLAFHVRGCAPDEGDLALHAAEHAARDLLGALLRDGDDEATTSQPPLRLGFGSRVLEVALAAQGEHKGTALARVRRVTGATRAVFFGDDRTDEDAFALLAATDLGVRVDPTGNGTTLAAHRVSAPRQVVEALALLAAERAAWLARRTTPALERCSILSDQRTLAVVDPSGGISWCCFPRADSSPMFAGLLGDFTVGPSGRALDAGDHAGRFVIEPLPEPDAATAPVPHTPTQRYLGASFLLETDMGSLRVLDYLDCGGGRAFQRAGRSDLVRVISGHGRARVLFEPRADFGRVGTRLRVAANGLEVEGSTDHLVLYSPGVSWTIRKHAHHDSAEAIVDPGAMGGEVVLELRAGMASLRDAVIPEPARRENSKRFWSGWASTLRLPAVHAPAVERCALTIKALCHGPTGAILAAATTSLPEHMGGVRNWDYRFCWPRDACLAAASLVRLGNIGHALKLLDWIVGVVDGCESPDRLRPIYTVSGRELPPEGEITHLAGFGDSRPVRISNAAASQVQLDVFGPIVDLVAMLATRGAPISPDHWRLVRAMVNAVEARWREPDHGIWEIRADRRAHTHSRVMCWLCVDRALRVQDLVLGVRDPRWHDLRDQIANDVLQHAWNHHANAFTGFYGGTSLDAAVLTIGLVGLLDPRDERFVATVRSIDRTLRSGPVVRRYHEDDGLSGVEGGMLICAGWLAQAWALIGDTGRAASMLDDLVALLGPTGTAAEQYCPRHRLALGNIAQAYSCSAIIDTAVMLSEARERALAGAPRGEPHTP